MLFLSTIISILTNPKKPHTLNGNNNEIFDLIPEHINIAEKSSAENFSLSGMHQQSK